MQILQVWPGDDHAMKQLFELGVRFRIDVGDLGFIAETKGRLSEKGPQRARIAAAQDGTELVSVRGLTGRHVWVGSRW
jgi:hypothetical protein